MRRSDAPEPDHAAEDVPAGVEAAVDEAEIPYAEEVRRKALHLLALVVPLFMALAGRPASLAVLLPLALLALTADWLRVRSAGFARFIDRFFGRMMRRSERPPLGGPVIVNGATWVLVTAALLALFFPIRIGVAAFVMFMIADAAAALVGRRFGRIHWGNSPRTVEGTAAFVAAGIVVVGLYPGVDLRLGAASVVCAALAEALPRPLNDNLRVPLVAALVLYGLERLFL